MQITNKKQILSVLLTVVISVFLVSISVYAVTTISTNIVTEGTVTMGSASTTGDFWLGNVTADDDDYLFMDASSTQYLMWDNSEDRFIISNDFGITGNASTTYNLWVGNLVADDDDFIYMDASSSEYLMWDDDPGMFTISDDLNVAGTASSTAFSINGNFIIDSLGIATSTPNFSVGDGNTAATSTIEIGDITNTSAGCLKILDADEDAYTYCYTSDGAMICDTSDNCLK